MGKHVHILSDLDEAALTATCAACGPVGVYRSLDRFTCARGPRKMPRPAPRTYRKTPVPRNEFHRITNPTSDKTGDCSQCGPGVEIKISSSPRSKGGVSFTCREAARARRVSPHTGLSGAEKDTLLEAQGGRCANPGCRSADSGGNGWQVDHCHRTGVIRGVLCNPCNLGLGMFRDNPAALIGAADYLLAISEVAPTR